MKITTISVIFCYMCRWCIALLPAGHGAALGDGIAPQIETHADDGAGQEDGEDHQRTDQQVEEGVEDGAAWKEKIFTLSTCTAAAHTVEYRYGAEHHGTWTYLNTLTMSCHGLCYPVPNCGSADFLSLTRRVLYTAGTAASTPALRTGWGRLSRRKWWSCRKTPVPTRPRWSAASTR